MKKNVRRTRGRSPTYKRFFPEPKSPAKTLWRRRRDHSSVSSSPSSVSRNISASSRSSSVKTAGTKAAAARLRDRNVQERMKNSFRFAKKRWNRTNVSRRQKDFPTTPSVMDIASAELEEFERSPQEIENKKEGSFVRTIEKKKKKKEKEKKVLFQGLRSEKVAKLIGEKMNYDTKPGVAMFIPVSGYEGAPVRVVKIEEEEEVEEVEEEEAEEEEELPPPIPAATTQEEEGQQKKEITDEEFTSNLLSRNRSASFGWSSLMDRINQKMGGL